MNEEELPRHREFGLIADNTEYNTPYSLPVYTPAASCYNNTSVSTTLSAYDLLQALQQMPQPDLNSIILDVLDFIYNADDLTPIFEKSLALIEFKKQADANSVISSVLMRVSNIRNQIKSNKPEEYTRCEEDIKFLTDRIQSDMRKLVRYRDAAEILKLITNMIDALSPDEIDEEPEKEEEFNTLGQEATERIRKLVHYRNASTIYTKLKSEIDD